MNLFDQSRSLPFRFEPRVGPLDDCAADEGQAARLAG
jgi:hypothetical protein